MVHNLKQFSILFRYKLLTGYSMSRDRIVVSTLRCGRNNPGSNPGHDTDFFYKFEIKILEIIKISFCILINLFDQLKLNELNDCIRLGLKINKSFLNKILTIGFKSFKLFFLSN